MADRLQLREFTVDVMRGRATGPAGEVLLSTRECSLLRYLAAHANRDLSREELLREVFEYSPRSTSRVVDTTMVRLRRKLEVDPSNPHHFITVHGMGYRFASGVLAEIPEPPLDFARTNIPRAAERFVGRERDLEALGELVGEGRRLITITGPPGIGKTSVAARFGTLRAADFLGGSWMVELAEARSATDVVAALARVLEVPLREGPDSALVDRVGHAIAGRPPVLLLLDNFEQIAELAPATVGRWLSIAPRAVFVVTSRERLGLEGEIVLPLAPLAPDEAVTLFADRAGIGSSAEDAPKLAMVEAICDELDRIPLAIELAAGRVGLLTVEQVRQRLSSRFRLLGSRRRDLPARQSSLHEAIGWSWQLLQPWEQEALAQCAVFAGSFSLEAAEAVLDLTHPDAPWMPDVMEALHAHSLLRVTETPGFPGERRLGMFESIRAFASEALHRSGQRPRLVRRHADHYVTSGLVLADRKDRRGGAEAMARLSLDLQNLLAANRRLLADEPRLAARAVLCLRPVLSAQGPFGRLHALAHDALAALGETEPRLRIELLCLRGWTLRRQSAHSAWETDFATALQLAEREGDRQLTATVLHEWGASEVESGRIVEAEAHLRAALATFRDLDDQRGQSRALVDLAVALKDRGRLEETRALYDEALRVCAASGNQRMEVVALANLAVLLAEQGDADAAIRLFERSLAINRETGERQLEAIDLGNLGLLRLQRGDLDGAESLLLQAVGILRMVAARRFASILQGHLGSLQLQRGDLDGAGETLRAALEVAEEIGNPVDQGALLGDLAFVRWRQGRAPEAAQLFARSSDVLRAAGAGRRQPVQLAFAAALDALAGDLESAVRRIDRAVADHATVDDDAGERAIALLRAVVDLAGGAHSQSAATEQLAAARARGPLTGDEARAAEILERALSQPDPER